MKSASLASKNVFNDLSFSNFWLMVEINLCMYGSFVRKRCSMGMMIPHLAYIRFVASQFKCFSFCMNWVVS